MPTSIVSMLGCVFLVFGAILIADGSWAVGAVLLALSAISFLTWWRMWEHRTN